MYDVAPATTRVLAQPMSDVIDPATRLPLLGSFAGPLPPVDYALLRRSLPFRIAHEKAWYYAAIASPEVFIGVAILRFGYVASTFAFLFERSPSGGPSGHFLVDRSMLAPPFAARYAGDKPIYTRWWFWGGIAAVAGAGAGGYFLLRDDGLPSTDLGNVVFD